jgi:hypothetical protein
MFVYANNDLASEARVALEREHDDVVPGLRQRGNQHGIIELFAARLSTGERRPSIKCFGPLCGREGVAHPTTLRLKTSVNSVTRP